MKENSILQEPMKICHEMHCYLQYIGKLCTSGGKGGFELKENTKSSCNKLIIDKFEVEIMR